LVSVGVKFVFSNACSSSFSFYVVAEPGIEAESEAQRVVRTNSDTVAALDTFSGTDPLSLFSKIGDLYVHHALPLARSALRALVPVALDFQY